MLGKGTGVQPPFSTVCVGSSLICRVPFSGVGIGVVHAGYERRLAHHLGAHSTPSILGLINGKITFFHNAVVRENLWQFVENLLPGNLVEKVISSASVACCFSCLDVHSSLTVLVVNLFNSAPELICVMNTRRSD